jgi:anti-sigma factor (TIGR02949 family)
MSEPSRMSCREALERLWAYIDSELPANEVDALKTHLDVCSHCYPQYDFQKALCQFLRTRQQPCAPPELRRRIFLRLLAEERQDVGES